MKLKTLQYELARGKEPLVYIVDRASDVLHAGNVFRMGTEDKHVAIDLHPHIGYDIRNDLLFGTPFAPANEEYYRFLALRYRPSDCAGGLATHKLHAVPLVRKIAAEETKLFQEYLLLAEQLKKKENGPDSRS